MKAFFFSKYSVSSSYFLIFPTLKTLIFCQEISQLRWKRHFKETIPFDTHSTKKLPHLAILKTFKVFLFQKTIYFFKRTKNSFVLRDHTILIALYGKVARIWWKNFTFRNVNKICRFWRERNWQTSDETNTTIEMVQTHQIMKKAQKNNI